MQKLQRLLLRREPPGCWPGAAPCGEAGWPAGFPEEESRSYPHKPWYQPEHPKAIQSPEPLMAMDETL